LAEKIIVTDCKTELEKDMLIYAAYVINFRAIPQIADGLKCPQLRQMWAAYGLDAVYNKPTKKCARIVGETMGKYHPHGDMGIYGALVRMAQEWTLNHPLFDGQGNFGNRDQDPAAAMRYTEARLGAITDEFLRDIKEGTVSFRPNYTNEFEEPLLLPVNHSLRSHRA